MNKPIRQKRSGGIIPRSVRNRAGAVFEQRSLRNLVSLVVLGGLIAGLFSLNRGISRPEPGEGLGARSSDIETGTGGLVLEPVTPEVAAPAPGPAMNAAPVAPKAPPPPPARPVTGVTDTSIKLGFVVAEPDEAARGILPDEFNNGNDRVQVQAIVDDMNKRRIHGRTIEPYYIAEKPTATNVDQRQCIEFAQDAKVFATVNIGPGSLDYLSCLARRRILMLNSGGWMGDDEFLQGLSPWAWWPSHKSDSRMYRSLISELKSRNFFGDNPVIGLITLDRPPFTRLANNVVKPALGYPIGPGQEFLLNVPEDCKIQCAANQLEPQTESAVRQFQERGVTHVMFIPGGGSFFFMGNAEERGFRPKYALESNMGPATQILNSLGPSPFNGEAQNALPNQLNGAMGIGWQPQEDIGGTAEMSGEERRCLEVVGRGTGLNTSERNSTPSALQFCDVLWAFEAAAGRAGRGLTPDSFVGGLKALGTSWPSVRTFKSDLGKDRPDGSSGYRIVRWNGGGFAYEGGVIDD